MRNWSRKGREKRQNEWMSREFPSWLSGLLIAGTAVAVVCAELKRPLRRQKHDKVGRDLRNGAMSLLTAATVSLVEKPMTAPLAKAVVRNRWGLLRRLRLPPALDTFLAVILLDYSLYVWHVLTHKVPFLWRFHQVHHADLDLDASTALRFHAVEMALSAPWRAAQVLLFGVPTRSLSLWQTLTLMGILFHHSNIRLPIGFERRLCRLLVTPRMHGIHHSIVREETDSNWATIFSWPDALHGTLRLNVPQDEISIGVPALQDPREITFGRLLQMPFLEQRPSWQRVDGGRPQRPPLALPERTLAD